MYNPPIRQAVYKVFKISNNGQMKLLNRKYIFAGNISNLETRLFKAEKKAAANGDYVFFFLLRLYNFGAIPNQLQSIAFEFRWTVLLQRI